MRNWILLLIIFVIYSCKENNNNEYPNEDKITVMEMNVAPNMVEIYKERIRQEFLSILEANQLLNSNDSIKAVFKEELAFTVPSHLEFKLLELYYLDEPKVVPNEDYEYYYSYVQTFWDKNNNEEIQIKGYYAIDEKKETIDNETVKTISIIW